MAAENLAWVISSPSVLSKKAFTKPTPGPNQAVVRITSAALNYRDLLILNHDPSYPLQASQDLVPTSDAAGVIDSVGENSKWKIGDKVVVHPNTWIDGDVRNFTFEHTLGGGDCQGSLQKYRVLDDEVLIKAPKRLSDSEGAAWVAAGATIYNVFFEGPQKLSKDDWILTQGTGGVSMSAIQIASAVGATVIATSSSDAKLEEAKKLGAKHLINYRKTPDWADEVLKITGGKGVDHVVDVGGAGTIEQSLKAARPGGLVSVIGILTESQKADLVPLILFSARTVRGCLAFSKEMTQGLIDLVEKHQIHPLIAESFDFEDAPKAFELMKSQSFLGKIVIKGSP